jgi:hypothetical protein
LTPVIGLPWYVICVLHEGCCCACERFCPMHEVDLVGVGRVKGSDDCSLSGGLSGHGFGEEGVADVLENERDYCLAVGVSTTTNTKEAAKFIEFAASPEELAVYDKATASLSPRSGVTVESGRPDVLKVFADQQKMLDPTLNKQLFDPAYASSKDAMLRELQSVVIGEITPQDGAKRMNDLLVKARG